MTQDQALDILKMGHNVYLTGSAGSGKTHLLNTYIDFLKKENVKVAITASTGIAATHIGGVTIHSWSGMGIKDNLSEYEIDALLQKQYLSKRFINTKVLIIDEVSMIDHKRFDLVDRICREFKQNDTPFGGMQVILSGDFFQLPPINKRGQENCFINKSNVWGDMDLKVCYLKEQHRQKDDVLLQILNDIRENNVGENILAPLRTRYRKEIKGVVPTKLYTHNADIDLINEKELDCIDEDLNVYKMTTKGKKNLVEALKKSCLAQEDLKLKIGAVVMFIKNNPRKKYMNGTLGKVIDFDVMGFPIVETYDGREIVVTSEEWKIEDDGKIKAELKQVPLRLAWAITIHKSQGMSLDNAEIDLSKSFVEGMGYVALSRVKTFSGLRLMGLNKVALEVNKDILEFDKNLLDFSNCVIEELEKYSKEDKKQKQEEFLFSIAGEKAEPKLSTYEITKILVDNKISIEEMAEERELTETTIINHLEKLKEDDIEMDLKYLENKISKDRLKKIKQAFKKSKGTKLTPVKEILDDDFDFEEIRFARLFL